MVIPFTILQSSESEGFWFIHKPGFFCQGSLEADHTKVTILLSKANNKSNQRWEQFTCCTAHVDWAGPFNSMADKQNFSIEQLCKWFLSIKCMRWLLVRFFHYFQRTSLGFKISPSSMSDIIQHYSGYTASIKLLPVSIREWRSPLCPGHLASCSFTLHLQPPSESQLESRAHSDLSTLWRKWQR